MSGNHSDYVFNSFTPCHMDSDIATEVYGVNNYLSPFLSADQYLTVQECIVENGFTILLKL